MDFDLVLIREFYKFLEKEGPESVQRILVPLRELTDLRFPTEWYPAARYMKRRVIMHVGPTNSGKTYNALKRLETAYPGLYCGPLRLLAHEIYNRFTAKGLKCNLVTGEERKFKEDEIAQITSCTVEMIDTRNIVDVAVVDEIQMIADKHRGWAWTNALLGNSKT